MVDEPSMDWSISFNNIKDFAVTIIISHILLHEVFSVVGTWVPNRLRGRVESFAVTIRIPHILLHEIFNNQDSTYSPS